MDWMIMWWEKFFPGNAGQSVNHAAYQIIRTTAGELIVRFPPSQLVSARYYTCHSGTWKKSIVRDIDHINEVLTYDSLTTQEQADVITCILLYQ